MNPITQSLRVFKIIRVVNRYRLDELLFDSTRVPARLRVFRLMPWRWFGHDRRSSGERLRLALEELGPIFVKFGQILSTRRDLLPPDVADELARLQDQVPPFPGEQAVALVEKTFGEPLSALFANFDTTPLASASIAQVHAARLHDNHEVIVKIVRPNIEPIIRRDLALMMILAQLLESFLADARRLHAVDVVADYRITILDELDMVREAANANQISRNFEGDDSLQIPEIFWEQTRNNVLVMERVHGIAIDDIAALTAAGIDLEQLAARGVEIFFQQVFRDNFFHADMHPGNIMVDPDGNYVAVDFGIVGTLEEQDKRYLAENFLGFFHRDYHAVAKAHLKAGWIPADTRLSHFESAIRAVCEPIFDKPLAEISFGFVLLRLFQVARRFDMQVQPQLVLLQKTLLNIEGLGRTLYPELDLWKTARPYLERWMNEQVGWRGLLRSSQEQLPQLAETLPEIPFLLHEALQRLAEPQPQPSEALIRAAEQRQQKREKRLFGAIVGSALLVSATLVYALSGYTPLAVSGMPRLPVVTLGLGLAGLLVLVMNWPGDDD